MGRVRIGTCANPTDGAFIRSMFEARGIHCYIGAEHHASLLGPIGAGFLTLDIWVDTDDAEEASALLRDLRETNVEDAPDPRAAIDPDELDELEGDGEWVARAHELTDEPDQALERRERGELDDLRSRAFRKRRAIVGMLSSVFLTFGTGHLLTGAPVRGIVLAAIEILGILHYSAGHALGLVGIVGAIVADVGGTAWRLIGEHRARPTG